jgi:hypothetical protein
MDWTIEFDSQPSRLRPTQLPTQWVPETPPSSAEDNTRSYTSTSLYAFIAWCLLKHTDNLTISIPLLDVTLHNVSLSKK